MPESKTAIPVASSLPAATSSDTLGPPLIPLDVLDAPTQRLYAIAIFGAAQAYKFYDLSRLWSGEDEITVIWFCMKVAMHQRLAVGEKQSHGILNCGRYQKNSQSISHHFMQNHITVISSSPDQRRERS